MRACQVVDLLDFPCRAFRHRVWTGTFISHFWPFPLFRWHQRQSPPMLRQWTSNNQHPSQPRFHPSPIPLRTSSLDGIAGFCDELNISVAGEFKAMSCKSQTSKNGMLSKEDLARLDRWRKTFGSVNLQSKDSPGSDAMTLTLTLRGTGSAELTGAERKELLDWVQKLYNLNRP